MRKIIISDTSTFILFHKIGEFEILRKVYTELLTTPEVAREFQEPLPTWIKIQSSSNKEYQNLLETQVDLGEASVIALASDFKSSLLLLDDLKARKLAKELNLDFTGTLGIIHKGKQLGVIPKVKPLIDKLIQTNFRISEEIIQEILRLNNE